MTAGNDQREVLRDDAGVDEGREQVAFEVVDGEEGLAGRGGHRFRGGGAYEQRRGEAGPGGGGEGVDLVDVEPGVPQRLLDQRAEVERVVARGDFRDHAAVDAMEFDL